MVRLLPLILFTGCASCPPHVPIDLPPRPSVEAVTPEVWDEVGPEARRVWSDNILKYRAYILRLETRIRIHNEGGE